MSEKSRLQIRTNLDPEAWSDVGSGTAGVPIPVDVEDVAVVNSHTGNKELRTFQENHICAENTTSTPLGANATFTGVWQDCLQYQEVNVSVSSDQNSATNGLVIEWSDDGVNVGDDDRFTVYANAGTNYTPNPAFRYVRVKYTNGSVAQGTFRLMTILRRGMTGGSFHRIDSTLKDDSDGRLTITIPKLKTAANTYVSQTATTAGNAKESLEEYDEAFLTNPLPVQVRDSTGTEISGKFYDTVTETYKGLQFNAEAPQICSQDYLLAMAEGDIPGHTTFTKYGRVSGINNTLVDVWYGEGGTPSQYVFPETAQQMEVLSSSTDDDDGGTGVNTLYLEGLDANYAVISETVTLNGTTAVTTTNSYLRINSCMAATVGSLGYAAGNIVVQNTANSITYGCLQAGLTVCRDLIYTVPAGKTLHLTSITAASGKGGNSLNLNAVIFTPKVRLFGSNIFLPQGEILTINSNEIRPLELPSSIPEKSDLKMSVVGDYASGASTCISAVRGWLE